MKDLLKVSGLSLNFGGVQALTDVSFEIGAGSVTGVIGPNGAGKTSLFNVISGIYIPSAGSVTFQGQPINTLRMDQISRLGIVRTFQNLMIFPELTALENVIIGRQCRGRAGIISSILRNRSERKERQETVERATELLGYVGLEDKADELAKNLPYGQQRQLDIARALATDPQVILLDEPAAGLNSQERLGLRALVKKLCTFGYTVMLIEHDVKLVMDLCPQIIVLEFGHLIAAGTPEEIQKNDKVISAYLGSGGHKNA